MQPPKLLGDLYLGIDVGGTNVKIGLVDDAGNVYARTATATPPLGTPERVFQFAHQFAIEQLRSHDVPATRLKAVGLAVPGVLDTQRSVLREVVNLPGWLGESLKQILSDVTRLQAAVVNDANAAAYAEHALRNLGNQSLALVTLGTGVGCGVVVAGRPHGGDHGCAGELGHIAIDFSSDAIPCTCGSRGHLESYAGSAGVVARLQSLWTDNAESMPATTIEIASRAEQGDPLCLQAIDETAMYVGRAIGMMGQTVNPAVVLIGGAMTFGGNETSTGLRFLDGIRKSVVATTLVQVGGNLKIEYASLGNDAGMLGAARVAKRTFLEG
ncbi:Glucokinase [Rubripirellula tenax]|uniref:Glucokinase n=1 Tax=Rubripirellula tenax TaxID=2528015 RepID=A0A5C6FKS5_9BACT|nr:ROK family protein [Rubripirellula tenax]TWU60384.1 Glucokinase [Rubripirellula tenax]